MNSPLLLLLVLQIQQYVCMQQVCMYVFQHFQAFYKMYAIILLGTKYRCMCTGMSAHVLLTFVGQEKRSDYGRTVASYYYSIHLCSLLSQCYYILQSHVLSADVATIHIWSGVAVVGMNNNKVGVGWGDFSTMF